LKPEDELWEVDGEDFLENPILLPEPESNNTPQRTDKTEEIASQEAIKSTSNNLTFVDEEFTPSMEQIFEAMLFVGGVPLNFECAKKAIRGLSESQFHDLSKNLNLKYKTQNRPFLIRFQNGAYLLNISQKYQTLREKLYGGPREARLSQHALDILSLIAYRQPLSKSEIDAIRGAESGTILRQLIRLGIISIGRRGQGNEQIVSYSTTNRFLELFQMSSLDDLPRLGETQIL
jgi:segregation and condensation protein B